MKIRWEYIGLDQPLSTRAFSGYNASYGVIAVTLYCAKLTEFLLLYLTWLCEHFSYYQGQRDDVRGPSAIQSYLQFPKSHEK